MDEVTKAKQRFSIIGNSPALMGAIERAVKVAPIDLSVLVTGESGSGKEFFPKIIHAFGSRKHKKYIAVNHLQEFPCFEHTQEPCLRGERELCHFVKENCASVGFFKITFPGAYGAGERAFLMSEKLAVDSAFRNCSAVDGNIFLMFP